MTCFGSQRGSARFRQVENLIEARTTARKADEEDPGLSSPGPEGGDFLLLGPACRMTFLII